MAQLQITGTLLIRGINKKVDDDRNVFMLLGVIAFPEGTKLKEEHLYLTVGCEDSQDEITLHLSDPHIPTEDIRAKRADQILTSPIWKV